MDIKFMQDLHNKEFATRDVLAQRATTIIAAITSLGGLAAFVVVNFKPTEHSIKLLFWLLTIGTGITLAAAASYLIYSYRVPSLNDVAMPSKLLDYGILTAPAFWISLLRIFSKGENRCIMRTCNHAA